MIASLGMYDRPQTAAALDRLWAAIRDGFRARGIGAPDALTRGDGAYWPAWQAPDLVFSQTCGLPFRAGLHHSVDMIGTPDNRVDGCPAGFYRSAFVARADDARQTPQAFAGAGFALNERVSQSGWGSAVTWFGARNLALCPALETGSHCQSAQEVLEGRADFAAIDAVTWSLLSEHADWSAGLKVIGHTDPTPALPYITAKGGDTAAMFDAVAGAIHEIDAADRAILRLHGIVKIPLETYLAVPIPEAPVLVSYRV